MDTSEHADLELWARKFGGTALLGFISTLLLSGKFIHHIFQRRGLVFGLLVIPPALISGIIGLIWFSGMEIVDPIMAADMRDGLEAMKFNLINFVFAALILGITCGRSNSQHNASFRGLVTSLFHEGMPMVIYSQLLTWGQTTCCLLLVCVANTFFSADIPSVFAAMVPLGLEAGADISVSSNFKTDWTDIIVEEAESLGLLAICVMGVFMFTLKPYFLAQGWLGKSYLRDQTGTGRSAVLHMQHGTGEAEAFQRATCRHSHSHGDLTGYVGKSSLSSSRSFNNLGDDSVIATPGIELDNRRTPSPRGGSSNNGSNLGFRTRKEKSLSFDEDNNDLIMVREEGKSTSASLGAHLALIALTAFLSFGVSLTMHLVEIHFHMKDHWLSGVRMFKLTMCCAMLSMVAILQRSRVKFNRDWFMHMCGLMLDLLVIAALSKAHPKPRLMQQTHYLECGIFVVVCLLWNVFCFVFVSRSLFPNYWFERAVTLAGDSMGHSYTGLLFVRTLDPAMESPVPAAYAYKLLLFFIPSSGAKQTIVMSTLKQHGTWAALFTCLFVVFAWLVIFDSYFRRRFVSTKRDVTESSAMEEELQGLMSSKHGGDTDSSVLLGREEDGSGTGTGTATPTGHARHRSTINPANSSLDALFISAAEADSRQRINDEEEAQTQQHGELQKPGSGGPLLTSLFRNPSTGYEVHASEASSILSQDQMNIIASFMSPSNALMSWHITYSLRQHGASLSTLLSLNARKTRSGQRMMVPCIVIIEDSWGYVFGGFISPTIQSKTAYYGNGESFVFSVLPTPRAYKWTGKNDLFVVSNANCIAMGGGGDGFAWQLDDELDTGVSNVSDTFGNAVLSSSEFFKCLNIEVWALDVGFSV